MIGQPRQPGKSVSGGSRGASGNGYRSCKHGNNDADLNLANPKNDVCLSKGRGWPCSPDPSGKPVIQEFHRGTIPGSFQRKDALSPIKETFPKMIDWMSNLPQSAMFKETT